MLAAGLPLSRLFYAKIENLPAHEINLTFIAGFVQHTIYDAIACNASDIHFEPQQKCMRIRFRIDGILQEICQVPNPFIPIIISHLKIRAHLDIAEKRLPQDGHCEIVTENNLRCDCRISTYPILAGEKIVIRLLHNHSSLFKIDELGMSLEQQNLFLSSITKPQGLILITGPTGSGKTSTLYTALSYLNLPERNISTIEDPVEIELCGINQLSIKHSIGLDFNRALKALLRQDPDIIMLGEIRDAETAGLLIRAAQTGHLVLSTLHTNNAIESLIRLKTLGVSTVDLTETLLLIIAQRLVRQLCPVCKIFDEKTNSYQAKQCEHCIQGYRGRTGIYEFFDLNQEIKQKLLEHEHPMQIKLPASYVTLKQAALKKMQQGLTSLAEMNRVIG